MLLARCTTNAMTVKLKFRKRDKKYIVKLVASGKVVGAAEFKNHEEALEQYLADVEQAVIITFEG
jgi:hypothetical protein